MRARMSSIMGQIKPEHPELFALEFGKIAESVLTNKVRNKEINE